MTLTNKPLLLFFTSRYFRIGDIFIYSVIVFLITFPFTKKYLISNNKNLSDEIIIEIGNKKQIVDAKKDFIYKFTVDNHEILIEVENRKVRLLENATLYQIGVDTGWIDKGSNNKIICLPLKIIISFKESPTKNNLETLDGITY